LGTWCFTQPEQVLLKRAQQLKAERGGAESQQKREKNKENNHI
jgi:hypothetical protein